MKVWIVMDRPPFEESRVVAVCHDEETAQLVKRIVSEQGHLLLEIEEHGVMKRIQSEQGELDLGLTDG